MLSYYDGSSIQSYTYDADERMLTGGGYTYTYDALGQRVKKGNGANSTEYIYFGGTAIAEKDQAGNWTDYIFAGGKRIAKATSLTSSTGVTYYHGDHLGSARMMTDYSGTVVRDVTYMPFGAVASASGTDHYNFTGMEADSETNLNHTLFRQHSPVMGRWMSPDPYLGSMDLTNPQSLNRYTYVGNDPLNWIDPDGLNRSETISFGNCTATLTFEYVTHVDSDGNFRITEDQTGGSVVCSGGGGPLTPYGNIENLLADGGIGNYNLAVHTCAANLANKASLAAGVKNAAAALGVKSDSLNATADVLLGNDVSSLSNLVTGEGGRLRAAGNLIVTNPDPSSRYNLLAASVRGVGGIETGGRVLDFSNAVFRGDALSTAIVPTRPQTIADTVIGAKVGRALNVFSAIKFAYDAATYLGAVIPCAIDPVNTK